MTPGRAPSEADVVREAGSRLAAAAAALAARDGVQVGIGRDPEGHPIVSRPATHQEHVILEPPRRGPLNGFRVLFVHAHADDETVFNAGLISSLHDLGATITLVTCTDGAQATVFGDGMRTHEVLANLGGVRRRELMRAAAIEGINDVHLLHYGPSLQVDPGPGAPKPFKDVPLDELVPRLTAIIRDARPHVVVTYDDSGFTGHPAHVKAHHGTVRAVLAAGRADRPPATLAPWDVAKLYYVGFSRAGLDRVSAWARREGVQDPATSNQHREFFDGASRVRPDPTHDHPRSWGLTTRVAVPGTVARKLAALDAHASQFSSDWWMKRIPAALQRDVLGAEHLHLAYSTVDVPRRETGVTAGIPGFRGRGGVTLGT